MKILDLCGCDAGAIYLLDAKEEVRLRAGVGFEELGIAAGGEAFRKLATEGVAEVEQPLTESLTNRAPVWVHPPGTVRQGYGIHSLGMLPVMRGEEVIGLLEVDRKRRDVLVGKAELAALEGFLPYVGMAVLDCAFHEELPEWAEDVEGVLKATEKWDQGGNR